MLQLSDLSGPRQSTSVCKDSHLHTWRLIVWYHCFREGLICVLRYNLLWTGKGQVVYSKDIRSIWPIK